MTDDLVNRLRDVNGGWASDEALEAADRIEELEAKLAKAERDAEDMKDCLENWFDTKKLAKEKIDPKVLDAAKGYLRTSRNGGMSQEESDLVSRVISDMAFRGVFSAIFTQFSLAKLKEEKT